MPGAVHATMFVSPEVAFRAHAHIVRAYVAGVTRDESGGTSLLYRAGLEFGPMSAVEAGTLGTFVTAALRDRGHRARRQTRSERSRSGFRRDGP